MMILLDMLKIINSDEITEKNISNYIPRTVSQLEEIVEDVNKIIQEVKLNGDAAIINFSKTFDGVELSESEIKVTIDEIEEAYDKIDQKLLEAFRFAKKNLIKFHQSQKHEEWLIDVVKGVRAGQIYRPIESVGLYVPGGRAIYPSTVLMAATPAYVAGVKDIIICSPPQKDKKIAPEIIVAAKEFEISKIYKIGGAQAIAAMAYGTETIPRVQKVFGPGNKWVNTAKQLLSNIVAIDTPAGPSEVLIIADDSAKVNYVIMDFLSQIEHDPDNIGIIVTDSAQLIENIKNKLDSFLEQSERKEIIKSALNNSLVIKAKDLDDCIRISNFIAPEHLEILTKNPKNLLENVTNAGAIFLGQFSPVPLGDYSAGTNHILPTGGNAKKYSGLNIYDFLKIIDILECNKEGLKNLSESATKIAEFEKFYAHKKSIEERLKD
ncbi:MAG: histidinol dehydrogenase [Promethearchaeota archaeon]